MKKITLAGLLFIGMTACSPAHAAIRSAIVIHIENHQQCQTYSNSNILGNMLVGALIGKVISGDERGAAIGAILGNSINSNSGVPQNRVCGMTQLVFWKARSFGRIYQGSFKTNKPHAVGQIIYVDGLP